MHVLVAAFVISFTEVLEKTREFLQESGYEQIPQLSSMNPIDVNTTFDLVPHTKRGTKRAVMIGINYVGKILSCSWLTGRSWSRSINYLYINFLFLSSTLLLSFAKAITREN